MTLSRRLATLLVVLFVLFVVTGLVVNSALDRVNEKSDLISERLRPASVDARQLLAAVVNQETGERGYLITGDEDFLEPYLRGKAAATDRIAGLKVAFVGDIPILSTIDRAQAGLDRWHRVGAEPEIAMRRTGDARGARALVTGGRGRAAFEELRREVDDLQSLIDNRVEQARASATMSSLQLRDVIATTAAALLLLLVAAGLLLRRWVIVPVATLRASMRQVADGNLEQPVLATGPPEVVALGRDAESMRRRIVSELAQARAAGEALGQHSPVVMALRRELSGRSSANGTGVGVCGVQHAAEGVLAGDWWATIPRPDGSTALVLADVSGHGAEAGLVALRLKERLTTLLRTDLDLLLAFEAAAADLSDDPERLVSCVLVQVDPQSGRIVWINAGHPPALLASRDGGEIAVRHLPPTGPLISSLTSGWAVDSIHVRQGELLVAVTDGVLDARRANSEEFGSVGVLRVLAGLREWLPEEAAYECVEAVRRFADNLHRDDVTCVVLALEGH